MKHKAQQDVEEFHRRLTHKIGDPTDPKISDAVLRIDLLEEECRETCDALRAGDLVGAIDGLCDIIYVAYGAAVTMGIDLAPFWDEVHRSNLAKEGGGMRADGKRLKPPGWRPPDIAGVLAQEVARVRREVAELEGCACSMCKIALRGLRGLRDVTDDSK